MRAIIRAKLQEGQSGDEIVAYFVDRYGESVLVEPPRRGVGLIVWAVPITVLLLGAIALAFWLRPSPRKRSDPGRQRAELPATAAEWQLDAARRELDEMSGGRVG
jgi:cytochrome c-type biogenesis protein CcmH